MEALIAISGLLAAVAVGAVGIGFATAPTPIGKTTADGHTSTSTGIAGLAQILITNRPTPLRQALTTLTSPPAAPATSSVNQSAAVQSKVAAAAQASATAQGTNQATLDQKLAPYLAAGLTLDEAESDIGSGVTVAEAMQLQALAASSAAQQVATQGFAKGGFA